ncbi:hypothetical protein, partial [Streptomyces spinoverrucosus]|uniref:hypothetical protein n=2 Tax=Streptomyces spinoverrucosus TaxID=284043 RepID=UPI00280C2387
PTDNGRVPHEPIRAVHHRTATRPDGSTVLTLFTVAGPYVLTEDRFELDPYLTRALLRDLTRDLHGIPDPGPRPESAALIAALDSDDPTAFSTALDAYTARLHALWMNGGQAA